MGAGQRLTWMVGGAGIVAALAVLMGGIEVEKHPPFTDVFGLDDARSAVAERLCADGASPWISLVPGTTHRYAGEDDGAAVELVVTVRNETRRVPLAVGTSRIGVPVRVVIEQEWRDDLLVEMHERLLTRDPETGSVYCLGESVVRFDVESGALTTETWRAGRDGARAGLQMPGQFLLGARYCRTLATGVSEERAEHVAMGQTIDTPFGTFTDCATVRETSPLEPDEVVLKQYAPDVGLVQDGALRLVSYTPGR